jgi:magnesium transporter
MMYANDGAGARHALEADRHAKSTAVWLDLVDPTDNERETAERLGGITLPSRSDLEEIESSSRLYTEQGVLFCSMPYSFLGSDGRSQIVPAGFVLSQTHLVTLRYAALPAFDTFSERFAHAGGGTSQDAFAGLVEAIVDRLADVLELVASRLDAISKETFVREDPGNRPNARKADRRLRASLTEIGRCGDTLGNLRDSVLALGRMAAYVQQTDQPWLRPELKTRMATVRHDVASLNDYEQQLNSKISFLLDAVLGFINIEQNNTVKVLTIASVVGIPPTFVVGLYGMNFKNMPEYDWSFGYEYGWVMILLSVIIPLVWLRIKGWL